MPGRTVSSDSWGQSPVASEPSLPRFELDLDAPLPRFSTREDLVLPRGDAPKVDLEDVRADLRAAAHGLHGHAVAVDARALEKLADEIADDELSLARTIVRPAPRVAADVWAVRDAVPARVPMRTVFMRLPMARHRLALPIAAAVVAFGLTLAGAVLMLSAFGIWSRLSH